MRPTIKHLAMMSMHVASSIPKLLARAASTLSTRENKVEDQGQYSEAKIILVPEKEDEAGEGSVLGRREAAGGTEGQVLSHLE